MSDDPALPEGFTPLSVEIESDGLWTSTMVKVNGQAVDNVISLKYEITSQEPFMPVGRLTLVIEDAPVRITGLAVVAQQDVTQVEVEPNLVEQRQHLPVIRTA